MRSITVIPSRAFKLESNTTGDTDMKKWQCVVCGFIYDEAVGMPEDGIQAGTPWTAIPVDWACPDCGVAKADFDMVVIDNAA